MMSFLYRHQIRQGFFFLISIVKTPKLDLELICRFSVGGGFIWLK